MARTTFRRASLLIGSAGAAMAAALALPSQAAAQAFNGEPVFTRGSGNVDRSVTNIDTITITSGSAILDWTPYEDQFGNALTFLPGGNIAYFQDAPGQGGFAVLNRILPSTNGNVVVFRGSVISRLQAADGTQSNGGLVAFYSPSGIVVGGSAVFDVGQLLLTTLEPDADSFDSFAAGGTLQLTGSPGTTAGVSISSGVSITANGEGSFFAIAAPEITMRGTAYINGSSAYVAGEQVLLNYNNGLFDIQIPVGTSVGTPIRHQGTTGGPASTGAGDNHMIYGVARSVGSPIAMLFEGNLGFDTAVSAGVENGEIILSAGYDVFGRSVSAAGVLSEAEEESISIGGPATFSSSVSAFATGAFMASTSGGDLAFLGDLDVRAARAISILARNGFDFSVDGDVQLNSDGTILPSGEVIGGTINLIARDGSTLGITGALGAFATPAQNNGEATGGTVLLSANGGSVTVGGDTRLEAQASRFFPSGTYGDSFGGLARISATNSGVIDLGGTLVMSTTAFAQGTAGFNAAGGTTEMLARSGGQVSVAGTANLNAIAFGGDSNGVSGSVDGGTGTGGTAQILASGGSMSFGGDVFLQAAGYGGDGSSLSGTGIGGDTGGDGRGGFSTIQAIDGTITIVGRGEANAQGVGGGGGSGGNGLGGRGQMLANGTGIIQVGDLFLNSEATGGTGSAANGRGGDAFGGFSILNTVDTASISLTGSANFNANARGGNGHVGGNAIGGNAGIYAIYGSVSVDGSAVLSTLGRGGNATAGFGGSGGNGLGGTSYVQADGSEALSASLAIAGNVVADASGYGGSGGAGDGAGIAAGSGGTGTGGTFQGEPGTGGAFALAGRDNAQLTIGGTTSLYSYGFGGAGGTGGAGQAGGAGSAGAGGTTQAGTFRARGDGSIGAGRATFANLNLYADGFGGGGGRGPGGEGNGGIGAGGFAAVFANGSRVDAGQVATYASGNGGSGAVGGDGFGGAAGIGVTGGTFNAASLTASANGAGGLGTTGAGGNGTGGEASIDTDSILNVTGSIEYRANGFGGFSSSGTGGNGQGGLAKLGTAEGATANIGGSAIFVARGAGGNGLNGGTGIGGIATVDVASGSTLTLDSALDLEAEGSGGSGQQAGGQAVGGDARMYVRDAAFNSNSNVSMSADAVGGSGNNGGSGGAAYGGIAGISIARSSATIAGNLYATAEGIGGSALGFGGNGGDGFGGAALLRVSGDEGQIGSLSVDGGIQLISGGSGGDGGNGDSEGTAAGNGGLGQGGRNDVASLIDPDQGTGSYLSIDANYGQLIAPGQTTLLSFGEGGRGGSGVAGQAGGTGGAGLGGYNFAGFFGGSIDGPRLGSADFGTLVSYVYAIGGEGGLNALDEYVGAGGDASGGYSLVAVRGGSLNAARIDTANLVFGGAGTTGGNATGGQSGMATSLGGSVTVGEFSAQSVAFGGLGQTGRGGDAIGGTAFIGVQDGTTNVTGTLTIDASARGGQSISGDGGDGTGGTADIAVFSAISGTGTFSGNTTVVANGFSGNSQAQSGVAGVGTGGLAYVRSQAGGSLDFNSLSLEANGMVVFIDGEPVTTSIGGLVQVLADTGGSLSIADLTMAASGAGVAGSFEIIADNATIELGNVVAIASGFESVGGDTSRLIADNGSILITDSASFFLAGDLDITTANGGLIGGPTVANPTAGILISTPGTVTIRGDDDNRISFGGRELLIQSNELNILEGARIGAQFLQLRVFGNDHRTVIGGSSELAGYTLTQAELGRIEAEFASVSTSFEGLASDDLLFRDTSIVGSLDDGVSVLEVEAGGIVRVEGTVTYRDAAATDRFSIFGERLEIVTPGGIRILAPDGSFTGTFEFEGGDFWMADAETLSRLAEDMSFSGRNDLLASAASGSDDPLGYLRAGNVIIDVESSMLVRNTGTAAAPGGITVTGTLTIDGDGADFPIDAFAFGRKQNSDGTFVTGSAFFELIDFNGEQSAEEEAQTYLDGSQFNSCDINTGDCGIVEPPEPPPPHPEEPEEPDEWEEVLERVQEDAPATSNVVTDPVAPAPIAQSEQDANVAFGADFPGLINASLVTDEGGIDDPVASGGDIALYGAGEEDSDTEEDDGDDQ